MASSYGRKICSHGKADGIPASLVFTLHHYTNKNDQNGICSTSQFGQIVKVLYPPFYYYSIAFL
jgi:hypothetical protein